MQRTKNRQWVLWVVIGIAAVALLAVVFGPTRVPVDFDVVSRGALAVTLEHEGRTQVRDRYVVSAPLPGRVLRIELEPGDPVEAGRTVLAVFEPSNPALLDPRSRAEAQARVKAAEAAVERAEAERDRARAEHALAGSELGRSRELSNDRVISQAQLELVQADEQIALEALRAADAALRSVRHELEVARAGLLEPTDGRRGTRPTLTLRSPIDGVVLRRVQESEVVVQAGAALLEVGDRDRIEIVADFLSSEAVRIRPGMPVEIGRWGGGDDLQARVRRVDPAGFTKLSALGVEEQRVNVIIDLVDPSRAASLGDAFRVEARVIVNQLDDAVKVPGSGLFRSKSGWATFVVVDGRARLREVEIGVRNDLEVEVRSGLAEGDTVIVHPSEEVDDGIRVSRREVDS